MKIDAFALVLLVGLVAAIVAPFAHGGSAAGQAEVLSISLTAAPLHSP
ncbi:hypothetical protein [Telmatospirillum sp. J64-1]|nr:hypothetical protein [Telmatospirillum sp. J64-1]